MTGSGMEDDLRRKAAQHSRDAYRRVKAIHISLIKTAATRQLGDTLKITRNELDEITVSQALSDIRHAIGALPRDVTT